VGLLGFENKLENLVEGRELEARGGGYLARRKTSPTGSEISESTLGTLEEFHLLVSDYQKGPAFKLNK
jgi:hypothetical protein